MNKQPAPKKIVCGHCKRLLPASSFFRNKARKNGRGSVCKEDAKQQQKESRKRLYWEKREGKKLKKQGGSYESSFEKK